MVSRTCPQCASQTEWTGNPYRPFCSERCRLLDLGAWIDERYAVPVEAGESEPADGWSDDRGFDEEAATPAAVGSTKPRRMGS